MDDPRHGPSRVSESLRRWRASSGPVELSATIDQRTSCISRAGRRASWSWVGSFSTRQALQVAVVEDGVMHLRKVGVVRGFRRQVLGQQRCQARRLGQSQSGGRPCRGCQGENPARADPDVVRHRTFPRESEYAMKFIWQKSRTLAIAAVAMVVAGAAVAVGRPHVVSEPLLGMEWQCSRTAFLVTTCSQSSDRTK